ncbi:unnamed protein product [Hydatigera taeniaeformis]|uniref:Uncharacterized protein n=1 Tax=Hydatigena taeniaeformis TaxID=6205 RepID=A0A3P7F8G8_HYDTA|nr:unnamed protein product [Hydatigera taeniaeformis]
MSTSTAHFTKMSSSGISNLIDDADQAIPLAGTTTLSVSPVLTACASMPLVSHSTIHRR